MFIEQPPWFYRALFPGVTWRIPAEPKCVYLTFDDGPIPEVTPWVLDILDQYGVKATFFMVGDNVRKHPDIYRMVVERGHRIGNHTFNHIQGIRFLTRNYLANTDKAAEWIPSNLFRPPHGHMRIPQVFKLRKKYRIIMWDVVTRDYSPRRSTTRSRPRRTCVMPCPRPSNGCCRKDTNSAFLNERIDWYIFTHGCFLFWKLYCIFVRIEKLLVCVTE